MADYIQISAQISEAARERLDAYARETGMKKGRLVEDAIMAHLDALEAYPPEFMIPANVMVDAESWDRVLRSIETPAEPAPALRELIRRHAAED